MLQIDTCSVEADICYLKTSFMPSQSSFLDAHLHFYPYFPND